MLNGRRDGAGASTEHKRQHTAAAIDERLRQGPGHTYLRDFIYGAVDGAVTTFAIVAGVTGAGLASGVIVVLGLANLLADGLSMAASNFLGTRPENQLRDSVPVHFARVGNFAGLATSDTGCWMGLAM